MELRLAASVRRSRAFGRVSCDGSWVSCHVGQWQWPRAHHGHGEAAEAATAEQEGLQQREARGRQPWHEASLGLWVIVPIRAAAGPASSLLTWQQSVQGCKEAVSSLSAELAQQSLAEEH